MRLSKLSAWQIFAGLSITLAVPAFADTRVLDPGFSFVDVNNDGLYSASDGDIGAGSAHPVDIDALIASDGTFDTGKSKGDYHARRRPAGLVVSKSKPISTGFDIHLHAGGSVRILSTMSAPSASLSAWGSVQLTGSGATILDSGLSVAAGGDVVLDGASIYALDMGSVIDLQAWRNISLSGTTLLADSSISADAGRSLNMDGAALLSFGADSAIEAFAREISARDSFTVFSWGNVEIMTDHAGHHYGRYKHGDHHGCGWQGGSIDMDHALILGGQAAIVAGGSIDLRDSSLQVGDSLDVEANGTVTANTSLTSWSAASVDVDANRGFDVSNSTLKGSQGAVTLTSNWGWAKLDSATLTSPDSVSIGAKDDISASASTAGADNLVKLVSSHGALTATGSSIKPFAGTNLAMTISAAAKRAVDVSDAQWESPSSISVHSRHDNVVAQRASMLAASPISFFAGGLTIDLRQAVFGRAGFSATPSTATVLQ
jgi:hypothetical protein